MYKENLNRNKHIAKIVIFIATAILALILTITPVITILVMGNNILTGSLVMLSYFGILILFGEYYDKTQLIIRSKLNV